MMQSSIDCTTRNDVDEHLHNIVKCELITDLTNDIHNREINMLYQNVSLLKTMFSVTNVEVAWSENRIYSSIRYNNIFLWMYRSMSGCVWHFLIKCDNRYIKHTSSYTTGLLMDINLQRMFAYYIRNKHVSSSCPKINAQKINCDDDELDLSDLEPITIFKSLSRLGKCGQPIMHDKLSKMFDEIKKKDKHFEKKYGSKLVEENETFVLNYVTINGSYIKIKKNNQEHIRKLYNLKYDQHGKALVSVSNGEEITLNTSPDLIYLTDIKKYVINEAFSTNASLYEMVKMLINYELKNMFTCIQDSEEHLFDDVMGLKNIPFKMKRIKLQSLKSNSVNLWLYFVEYTFLDRSECKIRLPTFVQPEDGETLHEKYRVYTKVIPGGLWLCKPFEYTQIVDKNLSKYLEEKVEKIDDHYSHVGFAMSGLWPFEEYV